MSTADTTALPHRRQRPADAGTPLALELARRAFLDAKTRTGAFACMFAISALLEAAGFRSTYRTVADRLAFAKSFAGNGALRMFYGYPYDVATVGGYTAWRVGGVLAIAAAVFGALAAVRALRAEEDSGRAEVVLAGVVGRRSYFQGAMAAIVGETAVLWFAELAGLVLGGLPLAGSAYLALATASVVPVFVGVGAVASQLAPARRVATSLGSTAVAAFWLLRVCADTVSGAAWLRWATPLGWAEELRPFSGAGAAPLLLSAAATGLLLAVVAARVSAGRDVGTGVLSTADAAEPSRRLLSSPTAQALRLERPTLAVWAFGFAAYSLILGVFSTSVSSAGIPKSLQRDFAKFGAGTITTPAGYLSFVFVFLILAMCLFACGQVSTAREEESEQRLQTLLALPINRRRWLGGRLILAMAASTVLAMLSGLFAWAGAAFEGACLSLPRMLEAGANGLPVTLLFLGLSALAYAVLPGATSTISYSLVSALYLWYLVGSLLGVPRWAIDLSPFQHLGLVPAQHFQVTGAIVMATVGLAVSLAALSLFRRRDLMGG